jgi:endonuclease/exonuclease/phosphatase (EEP) superfamily protein YafD
MLMAAVPRTVAIFTSLAHGAAVLAAIALIAGCVSITAEPRALLERDDGTVVVQTLRCADQAADLLALRRAPAAVGLDPGAIRIASWNIHKQFDAGWQQDLGALSAANDVVLLQEIVLDRALRDVIGDAGLRWVMASSFLNADVDIGVLTAARVPALANCTQRVVEPLLRLPKSAVISWFPIKGRTETLAVANIHAINFSLTLGAYRAQFSALGEALAHHDGPLILAGELNTWTAERALAVREVADRLGLAEVSFSIDRRSAFLGHQLDHIYIRGLALVDSSAAVVRSSDHNPVAATLRAPK